MQGEEEKHALHPVKLRDVHVGFLSWTSTGYAYLHLDPKQPLWPADLLELLRAAEDLNKSELKK